MKKTIIALVIILIIVGAGYVVVKKQHTNIELNNTNLIPVDNTLTQNNSGKPSVSDVAKTEDKQKFTCESVKKISDEHDVSYYNPINYHPDFKNHEDEDTVTVNIKTGWQPTLVTNVDYNNNTITLDYIQNIQYVYSPGYDPYPYKYENLNTKLRTLSFNENTKVYINGSPSIVYDLCNQGKMNADNGIDTYDYFNSGDGSEISSSGIYKGTYKLLKTPFMVNAEDYKKFLSTEYKKYNKFFGSELSFPFAFVKIDGNTVTDIYSMYNVPLRGAN